VPVIVFRGELVQSEEVHCLDRVARWLGAVVARLLAGKQLLVIRAGQEEASPSLVLVRALENPIQDNGLAQPPRVASRFVEIQKTGNQERIVLEVSIVPRLTILVTAQQAAAPSHAGEHEIRGSLSASRVGPFTEYQTGARICGDHQAIPGSENLLVAEGRRALGTGRVEQILGFFDD